MTHTLRASRMTHTLFKQADTCRCNNVATHALPASFLRFFVFLRSAAPWARLGQFGAAWANPALRSIEISSDCIFMPRRSRFHMHWRTHTRHMLDTCPTHAQHMFGKPALCWRCMAVWRTATIAIHCKDKGATRIKAQHGQSKPENNYSCHNPKTMQYSCHNPKR